MIAEVTGYFFGVGPFARLRGILETASGVEAHGLAAILGVLLLRAAWKPAQRGPHLLGLSIHLLLGGSNLAFWPVFRQEDLVTARWVTTALHVTFVILQAFCAFGSTYRAD